MNLMGMADTAYDCLLEHRMKKVDVIVQRMQSVATPSGQQTDKPVRATMAVTMPDVKPDMALGLIMPRCTPGFFPGTKVFTNAGEAAGQLIRDWARLAIVVDDLKRQMVLLPPDYLCSANGTDRKLALYVTVRVVKFLSDKAKMFIDPLKKEGYRKQDPYHPNAQALNQDLGGPPLLIEEGAYCHYPSETQQELVLYLWADQTNGPWVVVLGVGMMTHYMAAFCMFSLNPTMPNWHRVTIWMVIRIWRSPKNWPSC